MTTDLPAANPHPFIKLRIRYRHYFDALALLIYVTLVYAFGLWSHPLGRDYQHMAEQGASLPPGAAQLFALEMSLFGANVLPYRLVNLLLLYLCMIGIYHFINLTVRGFWWFGTFAACLFMANPSHTEAVLNLSGVGDLLPALAGIAALLAYAVQVRFRKLWFSPVPVLLAGLAMIVYPINAYLFLVVLLYEALAAPKEERNWLRALPVALVGIAGLYINHSTLFGFTPNAGQMFGSLYFLFYPLGFLPETAHRFVRYPVLGWLSAGVVLFLMFLILRKARRSIILFGILSMVALRLYPGDRPIDPVHMIGGGQLLLPHVLFLVSVLGVIFRAMDHPRWRLPLVGLTSSIAAIFFAMQIISNRTWHKAGNELRAFQDQAVAASADGPIGVLPDYRNLRGAPLWYSDAIAHDTPFSRALPAVPLVKMNTDTPRYMEVAVESWDAAAGRVRVSGKAPRDVAPWPMPWSAEGDTFESAGAQVTVESVDKDGFTLVFAPIEGEPLPPVIVPGEQRWYPDRGKLIRPERVE